MRYIILLVILLSCNVCVAGDVATTAHTNGKSNQNPYENLFSDIKKKKLGTEKTLSYINKLYAHVLWKAHFERTKENLTNLINFDKAIDKEKRDFAKRMCKLRNTANDRACILMHEIIFEKTFEFNNIRKERDDMISKFGTQHSSPSTRTLAQIWYDSK